MTTPVKFNFDTTFGSRRQKPQPKVEVAPAEPEPPPPPPPPTFSEEELQTARQHAHAEGLAAGRAEVQASVDKATADALALVAERLGLLGHAQLEASERLRGDAARLAAAIGRRIAATLIEREPAAEIEATIAACLGDLGTEPRVVVRVPEALVGALTERIAGLAARSGFSGQVMTLGDPSLGPSDCRIEWADGGATRSQADIEQAVETAIERYAAAPPADAAAMLAPAAAGAGT